MALEAQSNLDAHNPSTLVTETYHSTIELGQFHGQVAIIKRCRNQDDPRTKTRFGNEVNILKLVASHVCSLFRHANHLFGPRSKLAQKHITQLWDADVSQLTLTLRVESGRSLDKYVDDNWKSTLSPDSPVTLWKQISSALAYLHANSITHDDVKPDNIMWDPATQRSVLIDFGAALNHKSLPADWFNPSGTPPYAPPEFLQRRKCSAGDVWALGVTMLFAFKYIKLPDGEWILPHIFEQELVLEEMKSWLREVDGWRMELANGNHHHLLADMLEQDPNKRITATELELQLEGLI